MFKPVITQADRDVEGAIYSAICGGYCKPGRLAALHREQSIALYREALETFLDWAQRQCPCENEEPNPCPLCDASVENLECCKAIEAKFPRRILDLARTALQQGAK